MTKHVELDFFGEPVTFLQDSPHPETTNIHKIRSNSMAAMDGFLLCVVSKGKTCTMGGGEGGLEIKSAHSAAIAWTEALTSSMVWNYVSSDDDENDRAEGIIPFESTMIAPMLAVVTVAPILAQTGAAYVQHLDVLLRKCKSRVPGLPPVQMMDMAYNAVQYKDDKEHFNERECMHLQALHHLLNQQYPSALVTYLKILRSCPGDALAVSLAMDLSHVLGDKQAALRYVAGKQKLWICGHCCSDSCLTFVSYVYCHNRASGSIASYWNERRGGLIRPTIPGHAMVSSLMALGLAVGGRDEDADQMAARAMTDGRSVCGALATWAQVHVFDARGRIAEGISACANFDGIANYEGAGFLFFDCRLSGYGARFSLDREERGRGKSAALRLYEANFERPLGYSGFSMGQLFEQPLYRSPLSWAEKKSIEGTKEASPSIIDRILGRASDKHKKDAMDYELIIKQINTPSTEHIIFEPSCEDVLTWLPPTPALLSDATLLLLRFTLNGTISPRNTRWDNIRNGWSAMLEIQKKHGAEKSGLTFGPLYSISASLLFPPSQTGGDQIGSGRLAEGLYMMGELLNLGNPVTEHEKAHAVREIVAENDPNFWLPAKAGQLHEWKKIVDHLVSAIDGLDYINDENVDSGVANLVDTSRRFQSWDFEARPIFEHAICFAACKSGDEACLWLARSICSQGVTLRPNAPEEWWRYSIVLGLLGDEVGSEDALNHSINFGSGQGARS